jgi:BON domain
MIEQPVFGSTSPMWTAIPAPVFGPTIPALGVGLSSGAPGVAGPANMYGYSGGVISTPPQGLAASNLATAFPLASNASAALAGLLGANAAAGLTAPSLLTVVAMRRGQPQGPTNDQEVEDFIYDAFDLLPGAADVEVRCEGGRATLTGSVQHKRVKRDVGEIAWAIPGLNDVQNNVTIASRRRGRARETEASSAPGRKQS